MEEKGEPSSLGEEAPDAKEFYKYCMGILYPEYPEERLESIAEDHMQDEFMVRMVKLLQQMDRDLKNIKAEFPDRNVRSLETILREE